ncbi:MAG: Glu/Leu/Phe/Val dehydrogenase dimerization domain-containing protein [Alphaproteobacteria bacterium]|jgi:leucine dehydrogenase|nr:Glu/Leu/Phe/Val dehydrogenase dimerization domain-containing protein [Alphaproteobacteria bacterium]|tara:strand:- start:604 stop:1644 length:1041 start_codon:yes stop_codon:yes gene_type:complete
MSVFEAAEYDGHERVLFVNEPDVGLRAIIAIHNTNLGPALGGCRMWPYASEAEAVRDVLRLSKGMTYKAAMAKVKLGGGKSVIIADSHKDKRPELLHAMGRWIDTLGGRYITGEDIGTNPFDMAEIKKETKCVTCLREEDGGYGDPAPLTALGAFQSISAGAERALGSADLSGLHVALQGVGNVGFNLCRLLSEAGARLTVADVIEANAQRAVDEFGAEMVAPEAIYDVDAEVFAPCAGGAILNDDTVPRLKAKVIAGAANNQLDEDRHGLELAQRGIVYLPDYVANGGGLISCEAEWYRLEKAEVVDKVRGIRETCLQILDRAEQRGIPTNQASDGLAEERFQSA